MNRRTFLTRVAVGAAGLAFAAHLPLSWVPQPARTHWALDYMTKAWNEYHKGKSARQCASSAIVDPRIFDALEDELECLMRWQAERPGFPDSRLMFKYTRVSRGAKGHSRYFPSVIWIPRREA